MATKIVLPVDGSPAAAHAAELLLAYRGDPAALDVVALNVQSPLVSAWPQPAFDAGAVEKALLDAARGIAAAAAGRLSQAGLSAEGAARISLPADGILREAQARGAALIVMGTRGHGMLHGFALGSVAMRVAHGGELPVCLVPPKAKLPASLGRSVRVLLAMDGSEPAVRAARKLVEWRDWLGELDVQVAFVQQPLTYLETVLPPHDDVMKKWSTQEGEEATREALGILAAAGIRHHLHLSIGDPAMEIPHLADEAKCDLIAMGTRGRGAAHHAFIGSVALKVAAQGSLPVVLVK